VNTLSPLLVTGEGLFIIPEAMRALGEKVQNMSYEEHEEYQKLVGVAKELGYLVMGADETSMIIQKQINVLDEVIRDMS